MKELLDKIKECNELLERFHRCPADLNYQETIVREAQLNLMDMQEMILNEVPEIDV